MRTRPLTPLILRAVPGADARRPSAVVALLLALSMLFALAVVPERVPATAVFSVPGTWPATPLTPYTATVEQYTATVEH